MTIADVAAVLLSDSDHRAQLRRAVIASTVGTTIEWYDFLALRPDGGVGLREAVFSVV
jgi:hypothetical protein